MARKLRRHDRCPLKHIASLLRHRNDRETRQLFREMGMAESASGDSMLDAFILFGVRQL